MRKIFMEIIVFGVDCLLVCGQVNGRLVSESARGLDDGKAVREQDIHTYTHTHIHTSRSSVRIFFMYVMGAENLVRDC